MTTTYSDKINQEEVVLFCDEQGNPTGKTGPKLDSHNAETQMHLAFSLYVFNAKGQLLVTKRASTKKVWPGVWTNSCCGHLAPGETTIDAAKRRLAFELGMSAEGFEVVVPDYTYKTPPFNGIIEFEFCPVLVGFSEQEPIMNPNEVAECAWINWQQFIDETTADSDDYSNPHAPDAPKWSWWCKDQLKLLKSNTKLQRFLDS